MPYILHSQIKTALCLQILQIISPISQLPTKFSTSHFLHQHYRWASQYVILCYFLFPRCTKLSEHLNTLSSLTESFSSTQSTAVRVHSITTYSGRKGRSSLTLNLSIRRRLVKLTLRPLIPWGNNSRYPLQITLGGLQNWSRISSPYREQNHGSSSPRSCHHSRTKHNVHKFIIFMRFWIELKIFPAPNYSNTVKYENPQLRSVATSLSAQKYEYNSLQPREIESRFLAQ